MKVYELDPRHKALLQNHSSGYWWIRPVKQADKYKGRVVYTEDVGESLRKGYLKKAAIRRLYPWLMNFKRMGYVYGMYNYISLLLCSEANVENQEKALLTKNELIKNERKVNRDEAVRKTLKAKFDQDYSGVPKRKPQPPHIPQELTMWVWSFENKELNKQLIHIYSFKDYGLQIGKSRREFTEYFGLRYVRMQELAAGRIKEYKGWVLIGKPENITRREAITRKLELLKAK